MDVLVLIDKLDDLVHNAKAVPLTDQVRIDREEIYDILDQMRATIPEEIKQARWIVKERQEMLAEAKREVDRILGEAREQAVREASQTEIVKLAERQAQEIVDDARRQARETRLEMEDWADGILSTLEVNLDKFLTAVKRGRERLHERSQETVVAGIGPREMVTAETTERQPEDDRELPLGRSGATLRMTRFPLRRLRLRVRARSTASRSRSSSSRSTSAASATCPCRRRSRPRSTVTQATTGLDLRLALRRAAARAVHALPRGRGRSTSHVDAREYHAADRRRRRGAPQRVRRRRPARAHRLGARRDRARAAGPDPARARTAPGLCPVCGKDLNVEPHTHEEIDARPPLGGARGAARPPLTARSPLGTLSVTGRVR